MVRLTIDLIAKSRNHFKKKRGLSFPEYLKTLTHLHFSNKNVEDIGDISMCRNLTVLYLYDNEITHICNLGFASNLTHLYMQNNNITHIDNLSSLQKLSKLYLGGNRIAVVEGLEQLNELTELHLENQKLAPGEKLLFDPRTLISLAESLCVLNVNNNNLDDIRDLAVLKELQQFSATDNKFHNVEADTLKAHYNASDFILKTLMQELEDVFSYWSQLHQLDLSGNPVCKKLKYRDHVITMCRNLEILDGKEINELTRQFLINWKASKKAKKKNNQEMLPRSLIAQPIKNDLINMSQDLGHIYNEGTVQRWKPQQSFRAQTLTIPRNELRKHVTVSPAVCSPLDA